MNRPLLVMAGIAALYLGVMGFATMRENSGSALYGLDCANCHGPGGRGGTDPALVPVPPDYDRVAPLMPPGGRTSEAVVQKIKGYLEAETRARGG